MLLSNLIEGIEITGDIEKDVLRLLRGKECEEIAEHTLKVASEARRIALKYGVSEESAYIAGMLHDIGNIVPINSRVYFCNELDIEVIEQEKVNPSLLHQKISKCIAKEIFGVKDEICNAIECHSTMRANADKIDLVLFAADKLSWDSIHNKEFIGEMVKELEVSLENAVYIYLRHLHSSEGTVLHPRTVEAYAYLQSVCK